MCPCLYPGCFIFIIAIFFAVLCYLHPHNLTSFWSLSFGSFFLSFYESFASLFMRLWMMSKKNSIQMCHFKLQVGSKFLSHSLLFFFCLLRPFSFFLFIFFSNSASSLFNLSPFIFGCFYVAMCLQKFGRFTFVGAELVSSMSQLSFKHTAWAFLLYGHITNFVCVALNNGRPAKKIDNRYEFRVSDFMQNKVKIESFFFFAVYSCCVCTPHVFYYCFKEFRQLSAQNIYKNKYLGQSQMF